MTQSNIKKEYKNVRVICDFCNKEQSKGNLKRHQKTCPDSPDNKDTPLNNYYKGKAKHIKTIGDSLKPKKEISTPLKFLNKVECQYCKVYKTKDNIKKHERYCSDNPNREVKPRKEPLDYEKLNGNIVKCQYCNQNFHPSGLPKHEIYCSENPNQKKGYTNGKTWKCSYCSAIFTNHKVKRLHEKSCIMNDNIEISEGMDNFDKLRILKEKFPKIYGLLSSEQIKQYLEGEL